MALSAADVTPLLPLEIGATWGAGSGFAVDRVQELLWLLAFGIGGLSGWLDWKSHRVPNWVWILGVSLASPLLLSEAVTEPVDFGLRMVFATVFAAILYALWIGHVFGGADMKGFAFFGLILSPVGYYNVLQARIFPALDVLVVSLLLCEVVHRITKRNAPLFAVSQWPLLLAPVAGGLLWWPIVALVRLAY